MDENFIRERLTQLRLKKNVSEYKMSLDLGHSKSYIQSISSGKSLPSLPEFLYICEYLGVEPRDFFDADQSDPATIRELLDLAKGMSDVDLQALLGVAKRMGQK